MTTTRPRMTCYGELPDGTSWDDLPVGVASRIQWESTAQKRKWSHETHSLTLSIFLSWHSSKRAGLHQLGWDEFVEQAVEAGINNDTDEADGEDDPDRPTTPSESTTTA